MRILFITTNNLTTNPRLKKEIFYATDQKVSIILFAFNLDNWSDFYDQRILSDINMESIYLSASRKPFFPWLQATIVHLVCKILWPLLKNNKKVMAFAHHKRSFQLFKALKKCKESVDLVIAHNLGALYPAWWFAGNHHIPFNFDVEDYYPGERVGSKASREAELRKSIMRHLMPDASVVTYAAPLIGEMIRKEISFNAEKLILIHNSFPKTEFINENKNKESEKIQLVWFSQKISYHRGLERVINELSLLKDKFLLILIGIMDPNFYQEYIKDNREFIICRDPLPQELLHRQLIEYDVGLAVEDASTDINRDICLTNKIWAYYLSGLFILATDTRAQNEFMQQRMAHGKIVVNKRYDEPLTYILHHIHDIRAGRNWRQQRALKESFDTEKNKLLNSWKLN